MPRWSRCRGFGYYASGPWGFCGEAMKAWLDFFPVLIFFLAYYLPEDREHALYLATAATMAASALIVLVGRLLYGRYDGRQAAVFAIVLLLGGATLLLQDKDLFKWKPTVVNWLFAAVLLGGRFLWRRNLIQALLAPSSLQLPAPVWERLNLSWAGFFLLLGVINLYVAHYFSDDIWVNFKVFGMMGLTLMFVLAQALYISRFLETPGKEAD